ncbi:hypothetical protein A2Y85_08280 [candidate division WOR-3 bacterium RBG_13_43_14]|uniref:DNA 3'-5' helicase n=1 Tax=candidate division WOR-3 bacterium RBG_13_43_14 TaxID=1802590 RepID=A0A1F4U1D2_UNCW3|nr:MAG: hypothetical protein A2Y85_08280 [candidate division WOR-3 bacterium RBG_13_43_14]
MSFTFDDLNEEQRRAVTIEKGPILILAGAGSGKTRVITYRIAYLISKRLTSPRGIIAITFTNKAADEMKSRITSMLGRGDIWIRTFHSTCAKILRESLRRNRALGSLIKRSENYTIYDEHDQQTVIKECLKDLNIDLQEWSPGYVGAMINRVKEDLQKPDNIDHDLVRRVYEQYNKRLEQYNAVDFDDLIMLTVKLFQQDRSTLEHYQNLFRYILVDEYQDTNKAQYVFTRLLAEKYRNLCVVGDDDQSIYSWRGAEIRNILDFEKDFPETAVIKLEQNYRSTKTILKAASSVVDNNEYRKPKTLWCENQDGEEISFYLADDAYTEAAYVARRIIEGRLQGQSLNDFAVFYRVNYQSRMFEECFVRFQIPYELVGALKFYERAEIKNVLAYLKVIVNPNDSVGLKRIINVPSRKIGNITVEKLNKYCEENGYSLYQGLSQCRHITALDQKTVEKLMKFIALMNDLRKKSKELDLFELVMIVVRQSGYLDSLSDRETDADYIRRKNIEELIISIKEYNKQHPNAALANYLADVSLRGDIDDWDRDSAKVNLMTLHNAKGLEFDTVFITGVEDGLVPHYKSRSDQYQYEEERRLLYVGITRACKKLHLTCARQRESFRSGTMYPSISPFLREIPKNVISGAVIDYDDMG